MHAQKQTIRPLPIILVLVVVISGLLAATLVFGRTTDNRQQASTGTGTALYDFVPEVQTKRELRQLPFGHQHMKLGVERLPVSLVDGFQIAFTVSGTIPTDMAFISTADLHTLYHLIQIGGSLKDNGNGTATFLLAFIPEDPAQPFQVPQTGQVATFGNLDFTVPTGTTTLTFDPQLSQIMQHTTAADLLALGLTAQGQTFTFNSVTFGPVQSPSASITTVSSSQPSPTSGFFGFDRHKK